ncbi:MAG: hypothetical protein ACJAZO_001962 [Myxococcota bacterium]
MEPCGTDFGSNASQQGVLASSGAPPPSGGGAPLTPEQQVAKTALTTAILRRLEEPVPDLAMDLKNLIREQPDLTVRQAVWADSTFRSNAAWAGQTQTLEQLLRDLSPVERFRRDLVSCTGRAGASDEALRVVEQWVASHPGFCDAAISEGLLDTIATVIFVPDKEYRAIATLLFKGQLPTGAHANLEQAIAVGDSDKFLAAWIPLLADPTEVLTMADNPSWLHRVETKLGADIYQTVLSDVARLDRTQTCESVLQDLEELVSDCLSGLQELNDFFHVEDAPVLQAIKIYFGKLDGQLSAYGVADEVTKRTVLNTARSRLKDAWKAMHGTELVTKLGRGLSESTVGEVNRLLDTDLTIGDDTAEPGVQALGVDTVLADLIRAQAASVRVRFDVTLWVDDTAAVQSIRDAREVFREHIHLSAVGVADEGTRLSKAMQDLRHTYDQQYESSLVNDIHHGVDDDGLAREALQLIGHRLDPNARLMSAAVNQAGVDNMEGVSTTVSDLSDAMRTLAERFHDQLVNVTWVRDSNVLSLCSEFQSANTIYADTAGPSQEDDSATCDPSRVSPLRFLENHYRAIGGDLRSGLAGGGLDAVSADTAFARLGLTGSVEAVRADGDARSARHISARDGLEIRIERIFSAVLALTVPNSTSSTTLEDEKVERRRRLVRIGGLLQQYVEESQALTTVLTSENITATPNVFRETTGIDLPDLLSLHLLTQAECTAAGEAAGLIPGLVQPRRSAPKDITLDADDEALQYEITETMSYDFSLPVAEARAREWYRQGGNDGASVVNFSESGSAEENRIVREVFRRLYGFEVEYLIHRRLGFTDGAETEIDALDGGGIHGFATEIAAHTSTGDQGQLIACVMHASQAELDQLLASGELLHKIRSAFTQEVYDHVYRVATGQLSLGDVLRENDAGGWHFWMDFGSDEEGATSGTEQFIKYVKRRFDNGGLAEMPASEQSMLRGIFLDGDTQAMLSQEFSGGDLLTLRQLVLHGGERTKDDEVEVGLEAATRGRAMLDMLAALTVEERQVKVRDVGFMQRLAGLLSPSQMGAAMGILAAAPGEEYDYQLDKATAENGVTLDEDALMETLLGMPMDALYRQSLDRVWVGTTSRRLTSEQRTVFAHLMAESERMFGPMTEEETTGQDQSLVDDPLGGACSPGMSAAMVERHRQHFLLVHSTRLKFGAVQGSVELFPALQKAYNEKGEVATDPLVPGAKEQLFGNPERALLWAEFGVKDAMTAQFGASNEMYVIAENALTLGIDPSRASLQFAFGTFGYSSEVVNAAIAGVGEAELIGNWSNISKPGEVAGGASLKQAYDEYCPVYDRYSVAAADSCVDPVLEAEYGDALARFRMFPLDVSATLAETLRNNDGWEWLNGTSARDFLDFKMEARKAILGVSGTAIAQTLGIPETDPVVAMLNGVDRKARSIHSHQADAARHQVDQPSIADYFTDTDEQLAVSFALYSGEVGESGIAQDGELAGEITAEEQTTIQARLDQFNVDIGEYRAAKSACAEVMKWTAIVIIGAIATALTGPGGPGIVAAMLTAGAQATTVALINEAAQGQDFDLGKEGIRSIIKETAMAGLTSKGSELFKSFAASSPLAQSVMGKMDRLSELSDKFDDLARNIPGIGKELGEIGWQSMRAATSSQLGALTDAAFSAVDPMALSYGFDYGWAQGERSFESYLDNMDEAFIAKFKQEMFTRSVGAARQRMQGGARTSVLPGMEDAMPQPEAQRQSLLAFLRGDITEAMFKQVVRDGATRVSSGNIFESSSWDDDQIGSFMLTFAKGRAESWTTEVAEGIAERDNAGVIAAAKAEVRGMTNDEDEAGRMEAMYLAALQSHSGDFELTPVKWHEMYWRPLIARLPRDRRYNIDEGNAHQEWVLSDPASAEARSRLSMEEFRERRRLAGNERTSIYASPEFGALSAEQQHYYRAYLDDNGRAMDEQQASSETTMNLTDTAGHQRFLDSFRETKRQVATPVLNGLTEHWNPDDRRSVLRALTTTDADNLPELELRANCAANGVALEAWAERWLAARNAPTPRPLEREVVYGEFNAPY